MTCPKAPGLGLESSFPHPAGHFCSAPQPPLRGEAPGSTGWAPALALGLLLLTDPERWSSAQDGCVLCFGRCKVRCGWLYQGFVRVPCGNHPSGQMSVIFAPSASISPSPGTPFPPSFIWAVLPPFRSARSSSGAPAPSCPFLIALTVVRMVSVSPTGGVSYWPFA